MSAGPLAPCLERHVLPTLRVGLAPLGMLGPSVSRMVLDEGSILGGTERVVRRAPGALLLPTPWIQASSQHLIWVCKQM